jgi:protein subunit release factor A
MLLLSSIRFPPQTRIPLKKWPAFSTEFPTPFLATAFKPKILAYIASQCQLYASLEKQISNGSELIQQPQQSQQPQDKDDLYKKLAFLQPLYQNFNKLQQVCLSLADLDTSLVTLRRQEGDGDADMKSLLEEALTLEKSNRDDLIHAILSHIIPKEESDHAKSVILEVRAGKQPNMNFHEIP